MKLNLGLLIMLSVTFFACEDTLKLPVEEGKVVEILTDIHFAEAAAQHLSGIRKDTSLRKYYKQIFEIHETNQADFDSTMSIISKDPNRLKHIYTMVQDSIQVKSLNSVN